jgi:hypothetical protein
MEIVTSRATIGPVIAAGPSGSNVEPHPATRVVTNVDASIRRTCFMRDAGQTIRPPFDERLIIGSLAASRHPRQPRGDLAPTLSAQGSM